MPLMDLLVFVKLTPSKAQARRLVEQGGVKVAGKQVKDWKAEISVKTGVVIQVGSHKFVKIG